VPTLAKISFYRIETKRNEFFYLRIIGKYQILKSRLGQDPLPTNMDTRNGEIS